MLRLIRKFQLVILVVGGSLLMVVFLLQPILTRLSPSPQKTKIAQLDDGTTFTRQDRMQATQAMNVLKRVNPRALGVRSVGGFGLDDSSDTNRSLHWLLLVKQAEKAGLVGGAGDGVSWINDLAQREAFIQANQSAMLQIRLEAQQGLLISEGAMIARRNQLVNQQLIELTPQIANMMTRNATLSGGSAGGTMEDIYRILAQARGIERLLLSVRTIPAFSDVNAILAAHDTLDAVAVNAAVLDSSLVASAIAEPSDEQLEPFFDTYKAQSPNDNDYRIGYTQPTRLQLGWLTLDKNVFMNAAAVSRVELQKEYQQNRDQFPGDYALEKFNIERQLRDEKGSMMMAEADRIIRAQIINATKGLPKVNGILTLPEDWDTRQPSLENIAGMVVERINSKHNVSLPTPAVTLIGDRWLNTRSIASLPGYGQSTYRVGSRQLPPQMLPQFFELTEPNTTGLDVQVGLPLSDPASTDQAGNRYYAVILGMRAKGPADTVEDVTREQVVRDYKSVEAYKLLTANSEEFIAAITSNGELAPAVDLAMAMGTDSDTITRPGVLRNILVMRDKIETGSLAAFVDPRLNTEDFRSQVIDATENVDPMASPEALAADPISIVTPLPSSRSLAVAMVIAPRPVTIERFRSQARSVITGTIQRELLDAGLDIDDPFTFKALSERYGLKRLNTDDDEESVDIADEESDKESSSDSTEEAAG
ncbi:MAG: hypothetical protein JKX70_00475 [Phycisphaerales bacterium]|nr:hypothetical protein [Phycisphaerales bacterium]